MAQSASAHHRSGLFTLLKIQSYRLHCVKAEQWVTLGHVVVSQSPIGSCRCQLATAEGVEVQVMRQVSPFANLLLPTHSMDRLVEDPLSLALLVLVLLWWRLSSSASFSLEDKVVLITGAGNGIGKRLAEKIAHETKRVTLVLLDINEDAVKNVRDQLKSDSATVFAHKCDVSDNV